MKTETKQKKNIERQKTAIRDYLLLGLTADPLQIATDFGCLKASTRIGELEREGQLPFVYRVRKTVKTRYLGTTNVMTYSIKKPQIKKVNKDY